MSHPVIPVTLLFADGVSHRLAVPCGGKLVDAATEAGLNLLTDCSNGQCGTCTAQLVSGSVEMARLWLPDGELIPTSREPASYAKPWL